MSQVVFCLTFLLACPLLGQESSSSTTEALPSKSNRAKQETAKDAAREAAAEKQRAICPRCWRLWTGSTGSRL